MFVTSKISETLEVKHSMFCALLLLLSSVALNIVIALSIWPQRLI